MKTAITGASGLIGAALMTRLARQGNETIRLVRRETRSTDEVRWDPSTGFIEKEKLEGVDALIHLAGENIGEGRWTEAKKRRMISSRIDGTRTIVEALTSLQSPPPVLLSASAVGYYGNRGDALLAEDAEPGSGFLPDLCVEWEAMTEPAAQKGIRVVLLRFGIILSVKGGALAMMLRPFRLGVGGKIGDGRQYMSWVAIDDVVAAIDHALTNESLRGPVNVVAPNPVTNAEFTKALGRVLSRPTIFAVPAFAARLAFGEMADAALLSSARAVPNRLIESGFGFKFPDLETALRHLLKTS